MEQAPSLPRPSDKWIPWYFFAFFLVLISILVPMCVLAVRTNSGVVTENSYEKGLAYNRSIAASAEQKTLGWKSDLSVTKENDMTRVTFSLTDATGAPLDQADVKLVFVRPAQKGMDRDLTLRWVSKGHYSAEVTLPATGVWDVYSSATLAGHNYQSAQRLTLP